MRNGSLLRFDISLPVNAIEKVLLDSPRSVRSLFPFRHFHLEIPLHPPRTKLKNSRKKQEEQYRRRPKKKKQISMAEPLPPQHSGRGSGCLVNTPLPFSLQRHQNARSSLGLPCPDYAEPIPFGAFPKAAWFLAVYTRDVWNRLPTLLASATSVYGSILKIDSTKKICKKLQGEGANTASWATNVGNERGEVLMSVLTESESMESLQKMD